MSSQNQTIPVHHIPENENKGYRLIELPMELESLLTSDNPPVLTLESSDTSALLKTPQKTYSLRQKNTSNSLVLLTPHAVPDSEDPGSASEPGLAAVATIQETIELDAVPDRVPGAPGGMKHTGSKGKWHERFGRNR